VLRTGGLLQSVPAGLLPACRPSAPCPAADLPPAAPTPAAGGQRRRAGSKLHPARSRGHRGGLVASLLGVCLLFCAAAFAAHCYSVCRAALWHCAALRCTAMAAATVTSRLPSLLPPPLHLLPPTHSSPCTLPRHSLFVQAGEVLLKDSMHCFKFWASGRRFCQASRHASVWQRRDCCSRCCPPACCRFESVPPLHTQGTLMADRCTPGRPACLAGCRA
jgi:hypothetical protein